MESYRVQRAEKMLRKMAAWFDSPSCGKWKIGPWQVHRGPRIGANRGALIKTQNNRRLRAKRDLNLNLNPAQCPRAAPVVPPLRGPRIFITPAVGHSGRRRRCRCRRWSTNFLFPVALSRSAQWLRNSPPLVFCTYNLVFILLLPDY